MQRKDLISIRALEPSDTGLIFATWLKGLRYANDWFEQIDQKIYFDAYHLIIENILKRKTTFVNIACLKEDADVILGYAVLEPQTLHWVFVKPAWRGIGIVRDLVPKDIKTVTHLTNMGLRMKPEHVIFNPFL